MSTYQAKNEAKRDRHGRFTNPESAEALKRLEKELMAYADGANHRIDEFTKLFKKMDDKQNERISLLEGRIDGLIEICGKLTGLVAKEAE